MELEKRIQAIKFIRDKETHHHKKAVFCKEHNMVLDQMKHEFLEDELRRLANNLQDILETGYIGYKD